MDLDVNGTSYTSNSLDVLGYASNDTLVMAYQPSGLGVQTLNYLLSADAADENPANNSATQSFEVTDLQYGRDNGDITAAFPGDGTDDYIAMPLYDIINDVTIYGIDVAILDGSEPGTPIRAFLVDMFDDLALTEQYGGELISSAEVDMADGYTNSGTGDVVWYTLTLEEPYQAAAGDWIGAAFEHYGGANVQIGEAQYTYDQTAFVYGPFGSGSAYDWYYSNEVPMVRLNLDPNATTTMSVGEVATEGFELFPAFPNPASDNTRIQFRLDQASEVTFELRDVTGKLVEVRDLGMQPAGYNSLVVETAALGAGSYTATLVVNGAVSTQKLMVK
jgi:hypothetical protein